MPIWKSWVPNLVPFTFRLNVVVEHMPLSTVALSRHLRDKSLHDMVLILAVRLGSLCNPSLWHYHLLTVHYLKRWRDDSRTCWYILSSWVLAVVPLNLRPVIRVLSSLWAWAISCLDFVAAILNETFWIRDKWKAFLALMLALVPDNFHGTCGLKRPLLSK